MKQYGVYFTISKYQKYINFFAQKKEEGMSVAAVIKALIDKELESMTEEERAKVMEYAPTEEE